MYDAIAAKEPEAARAAMAKLIRLAIMDTPMKQRLKPPVACASHPALANY